MTQNPPTTGKTEAPKAKILVVEDDASIRRGLLDVLVFNGHKVEPAADGVDGLTKALNDPFDLVILDVMLPGKDGLTVLKELRREKPQLPVVMLTAKGAEDDVVAGFTAGADDYVPKPFSIRELIVRIEAVLRRAGKPPSQGRIELGDMLLDPNLMTLSRGAETIELTRREADMLEYLNERRDRIVSKRELLRDVWGYGDAEVETRTVDIHIQKLRKKLGRLFPDDPSRKEPERSPVRTVRGEGWRLVFDD